ncbi:MAG: acetyltransferase [Actinomycetota bacterium]|jgi:hypothetical protein|nr:acetyltransferase [Actinomycetota bacterium]
MGDEESYRGWSILELMGHRRLAGMVTTEQIGRASFIRIDVPLDSDGETTSQFYSPSAVYCLTPTTEEIARAFADRNRPAPVSRYELAPIRPPDGPLPDDWGDSDD